MREEDEGRLLVLHLLFLPGQDVESLVVFFREFGWNSLFWFARPPSSGRHQDQNAETEQARRSSRSHELPSVRQAASRRRSESCPVEVALRCHHYPLTCLPSSAHRDGVCLAHVSSCTSSWFSVCVCL